MNGRTAVIGAGLTGLTAARALARAGREVVVFEESGRVGGAVRSEARGGFLLELGPNTVRPTAELWGLVAELGLAREALFAPARLPRYVDYDGRLHAIPMSPPALLGTRLLSAAGKLRLFSEPFRRGGRGAEESVRDFASRRLGPEVAERMIEPFVGGVYAGDGGALEVSAAFPSLARWDRESGSIVRGAIAQRRRAPAGPKPPRGLLSFREGLEALPRALAAELGDAVRVGEPVARLAPEPPGWTIETRSGAFRAERVILAAPAWRAAAMVGGFAPEAAAALEAIPHPPLAILHLAWPAAALPAPLAGFGHLVAPSRAPRRILGAVWSSCLFSGRAPEGQVLLTVFAGGMRDPQAAELPDAELVALAARDLAAAGVTSGDPSVVAITRWSRAIPQYTFGHRDRIRALERAEAKWAGLRFAGNYRGGISVGEVVKSGLEAGA